MTSIQERGCLIRKGQAFETPTGHLSTKSNDGGDHKDPLRSKKPGSPKAFTEPSQTLPLLPTLEDPCAN